MNKQLAVITGGAGWLGTSIARFLALDHYIPLLIDKDTNSLISSVAELKKESLLCLAEMDNVANTGKLQEKIKEYVVDYGLPKILITAVGWSPKYYGNKPSTLTITENEWQEVININLTAVFHSIKAVLPMMIQNGGGRIVIVSSTAGICGSATAGSHYCAAKAGLLGLTKSLANEFAEQNILINAVAPSKFINPKNKESKTAKKKYVEQIPLKRLATVDEICVGIMFLISEKNTYMTGKTLVIDGGRVPY